MFECVCVCVHVRARHFLNAPGWSLGKRSRKAKAHAQACEWYGAKETTIPLVVLLWATSYFVFLSLCGQYNWLLCTLVVEMVGDVKKFLPVPSIKEKAGDE